MDPGTTQYDLSKYSTYSVLLIFYANGGISILSIWLGSYSLIELKKSTNGVQISCDFSTKKMSIIGTIYSKGITNYGAAYDAVVIHSPDISVRELGLFVMLAGSESNQFGAFIYGASDNEVKRTEIINNGNVSVTGDPTGNSITIKIGNWGRGVVFSYARFDIEIKKL